MATGPTVRSTRVHRHIRAPRAAVYRLLLDPAAIAQWKVPDGMTAHVHTFEPREGGVVRVSLTYDAPTGAGKTTMHTDSYHGRFVRLVPDEMVVETDEFETADPALHGEMRSTITLADAPDGGTDGVGVHERIPPGVSAADNEAGWRMALARLAALAEGDATTTQGWSPCGAADGKLPDRRPTQRLHRRWRGLAHQPARLASRCR